MVPASTSCTYTNIATIIGEDYQGPDELDGVFSGWNEDGKRYSVESWQYEGVVVPSSLAEQLRRRSRDLRQRPGG